MNTQENQEKPTLTRDEMIMEWKASKEMLDEVKEREQNLRAQLVTSLFDSEKEGTQTLELGKGFSLKAAIKKTYKLDDEKKVTEALSQMDDATAAAVVNWKPSLDKKAYDALDDADTVILNAVLTSKFGVASLEIVEPKVKDQIPVLEQ